MDKQRLLDTFLQLVRIDSPSNHEAAVAAYCRKALQAAGCTVTFDDTRELTGSDTGNLLAELPGTAPGKLYFSAHMDTVVPGEGIEPIVMDGIISARGETILGADDKVGIAAILELVRTLVEGETPYPTVGILLTVGEELELRGAKAMSGADFAKDPCFVLDSDGKPGIVTIGAPTHRSFVATFTGKAAHAGVRPEAGTSAIECAAAAIVALQLGRLDEKTTANVGTIHGGLADNIVAETCTITGEFRSLDVERIAQVESQIRQALEAAVAGRDAQVACEWATSFHGFLLNEDDVLVQLALRVARTLGLEAQTALTGGGSDANVFNRLGLRAVVLGTGMQAIHSKQEFLAVEDLQNLAELVIALTYAYDYATIGS
ncbi:MAG: M20/M25/M40 family metallo-hydrolase [Coriobacteriales bacterium]|jgi:tripeptide aminopeptidase|nr:M20/M25/M40 family metallo-hydrolase [Coriobacteriales bacterium]